MKRRNFFKALTKTAAVVVVAPSVLAEVISAPVLYPSCPRRVKFVRVEGEYLWYHQSELETRRKFEESLEKNLYKNIHNTEFCDRNKGLWNSLNINQ